MVCLACSFYQGGFRCILIIAHISQHRGGVLFQAHVLLSIENAKFWLILDILLQSYVLNGVLLQAVVVYQN